MTDDEKAKAKQSADFLHNLLKPLAPFTKREKARGTRTDNQTARYLIVGVLTAFALVGGVIVCRSIEYRDLLFPEYFAVLCLFANELMWLLGESKMESVRDIGGIRSRDEVSKIARFFTFVIIFGFYLIVRMTWAEGLLKHQLVFVVLLWGLTFLAIGGLMGFLFGIPRALAGGNNDTPSGTEKNSGGRKNTVNRVNTNLERISDWLTQIIVGGTVTQLALFPDALGRLGSYFETSLGFTVSPDGPWRVVGSGAALYFFIVGLLASYLITRLYLSNAIQRADDPTIEQVTKILTDAELTALESAPIRYGGSRQEFTPEAKDAANKILQLDLCDLTNWRDLRVWAKAQLAVGHPVDAIRGYAKSFEIVRYDAESRLGYAIALGETDEENDDIGEVLAQLEIARNSVMPSTEPDLRKNIYLSLIYRLLYLKRPESFRRVLDESRSYFSIPNPIQSGSILFNIGCAYGQAHSWLAQDPSRRIRQSELAYKPYPENLDDLYLPNADALKQSRAGALDLLKQAIERKPELRGKLREMFTPPTAEQLRDGYDDDFKYFVDDPDFKKLLENPAPVQLPTPTPNAPNPPANPNAPVPVPGNQTPSPAQEPPAHPAENNPDENAAPPRN